MDGHLPRLFVVIRSSSRTYVTHAEAFELMAPGDFFGNMMNAPKKYVVATTLTNPIWRNPTIIRDNAINVVRKLKAQPGKNVPTDGSSQLVQALLANDPVEELPLLAYPVVVGGGKRIGRARWICQRAV